MSDSNSDADPLVALAEEFAERYRRGERPSLTEYTERCPEHAERIRLLFPTLAVMEEFGSVGGPATAPLGRVAADPSRSPRQLGDYRLLREVGRGGMGVVYEAEQISLGRRVALKILPRRVSRDHVALERFRREARSAAKLHHTNIVPVFEVGREGGVNYYAMQFIQGQGLDLVIEALGRLRRPQPTGEGAPDQDAPAEATGPKTTPSRGRVVDQVVRSLLTGRFEVPPGDGVAMPAASTSLATGTAARAGAALAGPGPSPAEFDASAAGAPSPRRPIDPAAVAVVLPGGVELSTAETGRGHEYHRSVARIGQQAAMALAHAHARGVLHRDIKPSNLLLDAAGVVWVTDFGLAKGEDEGLTQTGDLLGTLRYMAPERFRGEGGPQADIYALGLTLYELLTLVPAFGTPDRLRLIEQVKSEEPSRPRRLDRRIPRDLETIVLKAADKDPMRRYRTADEMAEDLRRFQAGELILARPIGPLERTCRWCRRNPTLAGSLGATAAALVAVATIATAFAMQQAEAKDESNRRLRESNRRLAALYYEQGQEACEKGDVGPGLLRLVESWRRAVAAGDRDWQHTARTSLASWKHHHPGLRAIYSHAARVACVAFSPDGKTVITGSDDRTARLWDASSGRYLGITLPHNGWVHAVTFSTDGKTVLTGSWDKTARLWDASTGRQVRILTHPDIVLDVAFSPDSKTAVTGSEDGTARLWDASTGESRGQLMKHEGGVNSVAFSPDGETVITGSADGTARLWDASTGESRGITMPHQAAVNAVAFSPDGTRLITGSSDRAARIWDVSGKELGITLPHLDWVLAVAFSPDGKTAMTGGADRTARLWDAATGEPRGQPLRHQSGVKAVAFSPDGKTAITGSSDWTARLWDASTRSPVGRRLLSLSHQSPLVAMAFSPDGRTVLVRSADGMAQLWDAWTGDSLGQPLRHQAHTGVRAMAFSPDAKTVVTGSPDNRARLWDASTGESLGIVMEHSDPVWAVAFSPDGKTVLTGSWDKTARIWDASTGRQVRILPHPDIVLDVAFSPDGKTVITGSLDRKARIWDTSTGRLLGMIRWHEDRINHVGFSPDGRTVITGSTDGTARLWDATTGRPLGPPLTHRGAVWAVAFSPDGKTVITGSADGTARLWGVGTGRPLGPPLMHQDGVMAVAFGTDRQCVITGSMDGTVRRWDLAAELPDSLDHVASWVEALVGLTLDETGSIQTLDNSRWIERREDANWQGGPPATHPGR